MCNYRFPLIEQRADPFIYKHFDGYYYFTASVPSYDRIEIRRALIIDGLPSAKPKVVWRRRNEGEMSCLIWAPEIHYINDQWLIYFAAGHTMEVLDHRMYALACDVANPMEGSFVELGRINTGKEAFALDATSFVLEGLQYLVWAEQDQSILGHSNIYIARMTNPVTLATQPTLLSWPSYDWECVRFKVNEGPAVLFHDRRVFISYSASGVGREYCIGLLWADLGTDLLHASSWTKSEKPVFTTSQENGWFGPGHNSFTVAEDDKTDLIVYHARPYAEIAGDPLFDPNRHTLVQPFSWDSEGMPMFGIPGAK